MMDEYILKVERHDGSISYTRIKFNPEYIDDDCPLLYNRGLSQTATWWHTDGKTNTEIVKNMTVVLPDDPSLFIELI